MSATVIALLAAIFSIAVKVIGMPAQIVHNYERKSTAGLSNWFLVFTLASYCMWVVHGMQAHDMSLVVGQGLGVIATGILIGQAIVYRKDRPVSPKSKPTPPWLAAIFNKNARHRHQTNAPNLPNE